MTHGGSRPKSGRHSCPEALGTSARARDMQDRLAGATSTSWTWGNASWHANTVARCRNHRLAASFVGGAAASLGLPGSSLDCCCAPAL
eukprot:6247816-Alexandrium_andersonii.AAC.1